MSLAITPCPSVQFAESWDQTGEAVCKAALDMLEDDVRPADPLFSLGVPGSCRDQEGNAWHTWRFASLTHHLYVNTRTPVHACRTLYLTSVQVLRLP